MNLFYYNFQDREELITEHALRWNKRKIVGMVQSLARRYTRVGKMYIMWCTDEDMIFFFSVNFFVGGGKSSTLIFYK